MVELLSLFPKKDLPASEVTTFVQMERVRFNIASNGKLYITRPVEIGTVEERQWADQIRKMSKLLADARVNHEVLMHKNRRREAVPETIVLDLSLR